MPSIYSLMLNALWFNVFITKYTSPLSVSDAKKAENPLFSNVATDATPDYSSVLNIPWNSFTFKWMCLKIGMTVLSLTVIGSANVIIESICAFTVTWPGVVIK